jgi:hypothetical protein
MKTVSKLLALALFAPVFALAAGELGPISDFIKNIIAFMNNTLVPAIFALAFLMFLWGMFKTFILGGGNEEKQEEGKKLMMYSIAGFVIMVSLWGIVNLVARGFGFSGQEIQNIPNLPVNPSKTITK